MRLLFSIVLLCFTQMALGQIKLPIEVLGEEGHEEEVFFELSETMALSADKLWMQANNLSYENKASISINNGDWIDLNHEKAKIYDQELARGGMVHGGYNTIRLTVPIKGIIKGENSIKFKFNKSDGISNGYRVIKINLLSTDNLKILPDSFFKEDDPNTWLPIDGSADAVQKGKELWYKNDILWNNYLPEGRKGNWYGVSIGPSTTIKASCSNCHTQDGRDLELFSYSNKSIIERAKFHRLSTEDAENIASYIRTLSGDDPKSGRVGRYGRPWNPPYQPGPSLKDVPVEKWSAGAGLDAVLEQDADMLDYMFTNGTSQEAINDYFDSDKNPEIYTLPLAVQFPDWKHWLPMIHPMDAYTKNDFYSKTYEDKREFVNIVKSWLNPQKGYDVFRDLLLKYSTINAGGERSIDLSALSNETIDELMKGHVTQREHYRFFQAQVLDSEDEEMRLHWRTETGDGYVSQTPGIPQSFAATSLARLMAVKNFEFMNEFALENQAPNYLNSVDKPSKYQWFMPYYDSKHVFEIPAHISGCQDNGSCQNFEGQKKETGQYESTVWYQLQMVLTPGYGVNYGNGPVDFNYQPEFILSSSKSSKIAQPLRYYHTINNMYQTKTWSKDTNPNDGRGFRIRVMGPWYFLGKEADGGLSQFGGHASGFWPRTLDLVEKGLAAKIVNAQIRQFLKEISKPKNRLYLLDNGDYSSSNENWWRHGNTDPVPRKVAKKGDNNSQVLDSRSKSTIVDVTEAVSSEAPLYADHMYWVIKEAIDLGVECLLIDSLIDWSITAWPDIKMFDSKKDGLRTTTKSHLFEELREMSVTSIQLSLKEDNDCFLSVEALTSNAGNDPIYNWYINDELSDERLKTLEADLFLGDIVRCEVVGSSTCTQAGSTSASASITILSDLDLLFSPSLNSQPIDNDQEYIASLGDKLELELISTIDPRELFTSILWLDAMEIDKSTSEGARIDSWNDLSPKLNHAEASEEGFKPSYSSHGLNGLPAVMFGMEDDADALILFDETEDEFFDNDWTVIMVGESLAKTDNWRNLIGNSSRLEGDGWFFRYSAEGRAVLKAASTSGFGATYVDPNQFIATISKKGDELRLYINGILESIVILPAGEKITSEYVISIGTTGNESPRTPRFYKGAISELITFDYSLAVQESAFLENYLAQKWKLDKIISTSSKEVSPLSIKMITPASDEIELIADHDPLIISIATDNQFGTYTFFKDACDELFYEFKVSPTNPPIPNAGEDITLSSIDIPRLFTPNSDGINDFWVIDGIEKLQGHMLSIFSNSGLKILSTSPYENDWDGTYKGISMEEGAYYYLLEFEGQKRSGAFRIIR